jgi:hypothetical protein
MTNQTIGKYFIKTHETDKILMWSLISGATVLMMVGGYGLFAHRLMGIFILAVDAWFVFRIFRLIKKKQG